MTKKVIYEGTAGYVEDYHVWGMVDETSFYEMLRELFRDYDGVWEEDEIRVKVTIEVMDEIELSRELWRVKPHEDE